MTKKTLEKTSIDRMYRVYNQMTTKDLNAIDLLEMPKRDFKNAMGIKKMSDEYYKGLLRIITNLPSREEVITKEHERKSLKLLNHRLGNEELKGFQEDFRVRVNSTDEGTYYSAHYKGEDNSERHIYAPTLKRLKEILSDLENKYRTRYRRESLEIKVYKAFIDNVHREEIQSYLE